MKGLLLKDFYTLGKQTKLFLALMVLFAILPNSLSACAILYASLLPTTAVAYDERAKWPWLAAMMPYSTTSLVMSKYLVGYLTTGAVTLLACIVRSFYALAGNQGFPGEDLGALFCICCIAFLLTAINLPLLFRFGAEKARLALVLLSALVVCSCMALQDSFAASGVPQWTWLPAVCAAAAVIAQICSIPLSIHFYRKQFSR